MEKLTKAKVVNKLRSALNTVENKIAPVACSASLALGAVMINSSAEVGTIVLSEINSGDVLGNMQPFVNAAIPILAVVGGVKLGRNFLRSAFH